MAIMTFEAMMKFRRQYRDGISTSYSGWLHMLSVLAVGLAVIGYALSQLQSATLLEWLTFPVVIVLVNFAEYYAHRWLGHRKTQYGKLFYSRHTGDHHSFFLENAMAYESVRDWRVVLFPLYLIFAFIFGLILPAAYLLSEWVSMNVACIYAAAAISGYLLYEVLHFSYHIPRGHWAEKVFLVIPGWPALRHLHVFHHKRDKMAEANFNITLPIFDFLLGTLFWQAMGEFEKEQEAQE